MAAILGQTNLVHRAHLVHESARDGGGNLADLSGVDALLDGEKATAEPLGIADDSIDTGPPVLGAFIDATPSDATAECVLPDGGRLVGLRWEQAVDDGPAGSIEYLLYLVRATNVESPQLRDRVRNYPSPEITLNLRLSVEEIGAPVCVVAGTTHALSF